MYVLATIFLLTISNSFMTFAWYGHLRYKQDTSVMVIILTSWGIAFFEYLFLIPANRIGFNQAHLNLMQLKILQEVITLTVFIPFTIMYMGQPLNWNYFYAGLCILGALYFIFK